ncbi:255_t:CDS:2, partial [Dentiscutata erythropus]
VGCDVLTLDHGINTNLHQSRHRKIGSENFPVIISDVSDASVSDEEMATSVSVASTETDSTIVSEPQKPTSFRTSSYPYPPGINPWGRGRPKAQFRRPKKPLRMLSPAEQVARELRVPVEIIEIIPSNNPFTVYRLKKGKVPTITEAVGPWKNGHPGRGTHKNKMYNRYREIMYDGKDICEVETSSGETFICDREDIDIVRKSTWFVHDGKDNKSDINGVFDNIKEKRWIATFCIDNDPFNVSFKYNDDNNSYLQTYMEAVHFRKITDFYLQNNNGKR